MRFTPLHCLLIGAVLVVTSCSSPAPESGNANEEPANKPDKITIRIYADPFKSAVQRRSPQRPVFLSYGTLPTRALATPRS